MNVENRSYPVDITDKSVELCAAALGFPDQGKARAWLLDLIEKGGDIVDRLPEPLAGRRSPSGYFFLVKDTIALPLADLTADQGKWLATSCLVFPGHRVEIPLDPFAMTGREVLELCSVSRHAVERFQQRCGGHINTARAQRELVKRIGPTVRVARRPPVWCHTRSAEFYLIAGARDEYCLPCGKGAGDKPFEIITCIHRAGDYFSLNPTRLSALCQVNPAAFPPNSWRLRLLTDAFHFSGQLKWGNPRWAEYHPGAHWWIVFHNQLAAPVAWQPEQEMHPLLILDLVDKRPFVLRLLSRFRR